MLKMFKEIINKNTDEITSDDYELAIYYHILNNKLSDAKEITKKALKIFPKFEIYN
jgi:hypothetical protein